MYNIISPVVCVLFWRVMDGSILRSWSPRSSGDVKTSGSYTAFNQCLSQHFSITIDVSPRIGIMTSARGPRSRNGTFQQLKRVFWTQRIQVNNIAMRFYVVPLKPIHLN